MEQLDEALGRLLNDPGAMSQVMSLAQRLGAVPPAQEDSPPADGPELSKMLSARKTDERQTALAQALGAYLSPRRREKLQRALQLVRLSGILKTAMQQREPDDRRGF